MYNNNASSLGLVMRIDLASILASTIKLDHAMRNIFWNLNETFNLRLCGWEEMQLIKIEGSAICRPPLHIELIDASIVLRDLYLNINHAVCMDVYKSE